MRCTKVQRNLVPYLDGAIRRRLGSAVGRHLERCPRCRAEAVEIRRILAAAAGPIPAVNPYLETRLMAAVSEVASEQEWTSAGSLRWVRWVAPAAGLAALLVIGVHLERVSRSPVRVEAPAVAQAPRTRALGAPLQSSHPERQTSAQTQVAARVRREEPPPEFVKNIDFFVNYPIIRDLDALAAFKASSSRHQTGGQTRVRREDHSLG